MGNKTIKAMTDKGDVAKMMEIFKSNDPLTIGKQLNLWNRKAATSKDVIAMILKKPDAANEARALVGKTDPALALPGR